MSYLARPFAGSYLFILVLSLLDWGGSCWGWRWCWKERLLNGQLLPQRSLLLGQRGLPPAGEN